MVGVFSFRKVLPIFVRITFVRIIFVRIIIIVGIYSELVTLAVS